MQNKTIVTSMAILTVAIIGMMIIPTTFAQPSKNTKEINCDDCTLRFSGKNDVTVKFNSNGGGGTGQQGEKGDKGDTGATGATGAQGEKGDKGDTGATGEQGQKGDKGDTGEAGVSGVSGTNGTVLDNQTVDNLQYINENIDTIKAIVEAWNDGSLGVPSEVNETGTPIPIENATTPEVPPIANETTTPVENQTTPLPSINVTTPENTTGNIPINVTGNLTVPGGNFSGDVNVTLPEGGNVTAPEGNATANVTPTNFVGSVFTQLFG